MPQESVETVRRHNEAWNRRDRMTWLASFAAGGEIDWSRSRGPLKGVYRGHGEHQVFWDACWSTFEDVEVEHHGLTGVGSEVVVPNTAHVRDRDGIEVIVRTTFVFTVENAQITRQRLFQARAEALEAAGLREQDESLQHGKEAPSTAPRSARSRSRARASPTPGAFARVRGHRHVRSGR